MLVIKLADRLHNMRTISVMPEWKQRRTAQQTLDIYAPLAHRLGIQQVKWQLEDLSFKTLHPKRYAEIEQMVATRAPRREQELEQVMGILRGRLGALGIEASVTGRPKNLFSIYEKMVVRGKEFDEIHDLLGIRIVVNSEKDCWAALGSVHALWPPVQGRFKDYINSPKFNLYQSLHTTVVGTGGKPLEIQIRTQEMHRRAEFGIAAHWGYKESVSHPGSARSAEDIAWLQRIVDWERDTPDPIEFLENLKLDLEQDEVYVFTPKGAIVTLPSKATPVDFAYAIHTEVGHRCVGARVNGRLVPLDATLQSGDTVEIFTSKLPTRGPLEGLAEDRRLAPRPQQDPPVVLPRAARGRDRGRTGRARQGDAPGGLARAEADQLVGAADAGLGDGLLGPRRALRRRSATDTTPPAASCNACNASCSAASTRSSYPRRHSSRAGAAIAPARSGVYVEGLDDVMVRLSRCCTPVPGDKIIGFVTRGRGVSVHREGCVERAGGGRRGSGTPDRGGVGREPQRRVRRSHRAQGDRPDAAARRRRPAACRAPRHHPGFVLAGRGR